MNQLQPESATENSSDSAHTGNPQNIGSANLQPTVSSGGFQTGTQSIPLARYIPTTVPIAPVAGTIGKASVLPQRSNSQSLSFIIGCSLLFMGGIVVAVYMYRAAQKQRRTVR